MSTVNMHDENFNDLEVYIASLNHMIQTLTTVGYGNYTGFTAREYIVCIVLEFFGIMLFVYLMQQIKYTFNQVDEIEEKQKAEASI